jgi:hypothetical protein
MHETIESPPSYVSRVWRNGIRSLHCDRAAEGASVLLHAGLGEAVIAGPIRCFHLLLVANRFTLSGIGTATICTMAVPSRVNNSKT